MTPTLAPVTTPIQAIKHQYALLHRIERLLATRQPPVTKALLDTYRHQLECGHLSREGVYHTENMVGLMEARV